MPETTEKILTQLNAKKRGYEEMDTFGQYESGTKVTVLRKFVYAS